MKTTYYFYNRIPEGMAGKRIVFNTETPNSYGFSVPNDVLDFTRFHKNPVLLKQHDWESLPLGAMTDIRYSSGEWTGIPLFHRKTADSNEYADLWEAGFLNACSIGGFKELKTTGRTTRDKDGNQVPEVWTDKNGIAEATHFEVIEISMVTIPSNPDAVAEKPETLSLKCYDNIQIGNYEKQLSTLSIKLKNMNEQELEADKLAEEMEKVKQDKAKADKLAAKKPDDKPKADDLPEPIKGEVSADETKKKAGLGAVVERMFNSALAALTGKETIYDSPKTDLDPPAPKNLPDTKDSKEAEKVLFDKLPEQVGKMKAKKEKLELAKMTASELMADALEAKEKADKDDATAEDKEEFTAKKEKADDALKACEELDADMEDDDSEDGLKAKKEKLAAKLAAGKFRKKTMEELKADQLKLAPKPNNSNRIAFTGGTPKTLTQLKADPQGKRLIEKVQHRAEGTEPAEYAAYMSALRNETRFKPVFDKARVILGANEGNYKTFRQNSRSNPGEGVDQIIARLQAGRVNWMTRNGELREATTLNATDTFLASPDLQAMDFLDLAIFQLFPTTGWKGAIPVFGADSTEKNTGIIWANIAANPQIYMGESAPVNPASYSYQDTPVALNLTAFWMNPILWQPLTMAQLRYNQMDTGWAQSFAVMGTYIDDFLLYTLASAVPHKSIVYSSGISPNPTGGNTAVQSFVLNGNQDNPYSFYYNPGFQGSLTNPTLNDVLMPELIYNKQNYELENEKPMIAMDPTTYTLIKQTGQSQSLLTRWVDDNGKDQWGFSHTKFSQRSRVIAFDPTTAQVKSPFGIIPSTATSANLCYIPSQVGIGIGNLDVFMIQSPSDYGYKMSADVRMGITPLRANGNGIGILAYGPQDIS